MTRPDDASLLEEIAALVAEPVSDEPTRLIARIEHTLTAGYARALALEAERLRIERRIGAVASELAEGETRDRVDELADLARRASAADGDLGRLRRVLASLRERARELRASAASGS